MSGGDQLVGVIAGLLCLTLVGSALLARRLDCRTTMRLMLIWAAIFVAVIAAIRLSDIA